MKWPTSNPSREHNWDMLWLALTFTLLHLVHAPLWPLLVFAGLTFVLWALNVYADILEARMERDFPGLRSQSETEGDAKC